MTTITKPIQMIHRVVTHSPVVCILSGGMDSTTLVYWLNKEYDVHLLSFNYGQRHKKELHYAMKTGVKLKLVHRIVNLSCLRLLLKSALTGNSEIPEGHYEDKSMKATVVPNRNMIMLSIAAGYASSIGARKVFFAAHSGDHEIYPDCRPEFVEKLSEVTKISDYTPVTIEAPFIKLDKGDIAKIGKEIGVPYENTWTCYIGADKPCSRCGSCSERILAFYNNDTKDPLYKTEKEWNEAVEIALSKK